MMLSKFFPFPYLSVYDIDIAWFAFWLGCTQTNTHSRKPRNTWPSCSVQPCKSTASMSYGEKKESHIMLECLQDALLFTLLFCSFPCFSCTLSPILALESGKKRVVVVVVVGNISCEWCPSPVTPELMFNHSPTPIKPLTQTTSHPLYISVIQCCCYSVCGSRFVTLLLSRVVFWDRRSILTYHRSPYFVIRLTKSSYLWNENVFIFWSRCGKEAVLLEMRK